MTVAIRTSPQILKSLQNDTLQIVSLHNLIQNHSLSYFRVNGLLSIAGHLPSEGRVGEGKGEGRIGFFDGREGKEKECLVQ